MHPTIDLDFFELPVYSALVGLGMVFGLASACLFLRSRSRRPVQYAGPEIFLDGALFVVAAGWIGARAYHVAMHWDYYSARTEEIIQFGLGGLAFRGAFIVGVIALALYTKVREISFWRLADAAALGLAVGQAIGWVGALVQGANYGIVSDSPAAMDLPDLYGLVEPRLPLQHAEIALFAVLFIALIVLAMRHPRQGTLFLAYLLVASLANVALGFARGDESTYLGSWRVDQIVDAILGLLGVAGLMWRELHARAPAMGRGNFGNVING